MSEQIAISLIASVIGGVVVAIINQVFGIRKTNAEAEKMRAEAEKIRMEAAKIRTEIEKLNASVMIGNQRIISTITAGEKEVDIQETPYTIRREAS